MEIDLKVKLKIANYFIDLEYFILLWDLKLKDILKMKHRKKSFSYLYIK